MMFILLVPSIVIAQNEYHDDEFGFALSVPLKWQMSFEHQWSEKLKSFLKNRYSGHAVLMINPLGVEPSKNPCIQVHAKELVRTTTSEAITDLKKTGNEILMKSSKYLARDLLGRKSKKYKEIDKFYDYDSKKHLAIAKVLYQDNEGGTYALVARAKFIGLQRVVDFDGYWKGDENPEQFWGVFTQVIDSFEFDADAKPKGIIGSIPQEIKEISKLSREQKVSRIFKWFSIAW